MVDSKKVHSKLISGSEWDIPTDSPKFSTLTDLLYVYSLFIYLKFSISTLQNIEM